MRLNHRWLWLAMTLLVLASVPNSFAGSSFGTDGPAPPFNPSNPPPLPSSPPPLPSSLPPQTLGTTTNSHSETSGVMSLPQTYIVPANPQPAASAVTSQTQKFESNSHSQSQSFNAPEQPQPVGTRRTRAETWGTSSKSHGYSLLTPQAHQLDIEANDTYQFITSNSIVKRRVDSERAAYIHLPGDLGNSTMQLPEVQITYWFDSDSAAQLQSRYFVLSGDHNVSYPLGFGGATLAPGQVLSTKGTRWFTVGGFYVRRLTPLYEDSQVELPRWLQGWDVRGKVGLEFSYVDFRINDGSPAFTGVSLFEARMRFHDKGLPIPTVGVEARKWLARKVALEITAQGNWINKINSGRTENGTVYDSQAGFETHWRLIYDTPELRGLSPYGGINYYYYKYDQSGAGVENLIRTQMFGPELGFNYSL